MLEIDWIVLIMVAVVLWLPATLLYPAEAKDRLARTFSARFRPEYMAGTWQHWLDLARAFLGTHFLVTEGVNFVPGDSGQGYWNQDLILIGGVLAAAVVLQTVHFRKSFYFTAPIFFIWGLTLGLYGWLPAVFAIVFSTIMARLFDHVELKLPLMAALLGVVGYLVSGLSLKLIMAVGLVVLPMLVAFGCMRHLVCYSRTEPPRSQ